MLAQLDNMNIMQVCHILNNEQNAFQLCWEAELLANDIYCGDDCLGVLRPYHDPSVKYGIRVKCDVCNTKRSILYSSIFTRTKLPLQKALIIIYLWSYKTPVEVAAFMAGVNRKTVTSFYQSIRDACSEIAETEGEQIGGPGKTVEIDETQYVKRKNHVGAVRGNMDVWIFGGICREDKKRFAVQVPDRKATTLATEILKHVNIQSTLISDSYRSYTNVHNLGYNHQMVNHSQNFVDPNTGAHTQTVERMWRDLKESRKRYNGVPEEEIDGHINEYMWRRNELVTSKNCFRKTLELLSRVNFK